MHFYDVGEGLATLVDLPDGRHVVVDTGNGARRAGCGEDCARADERWMRALRRDLHGDPIALVWITHQHADHLGGAPELLGAFDVKLYVDNGRDADKPEVRRAHDAALARAVARRTVDPQHLEGPLAASPGTTLTPVVPAAWPPSCTRDPNECTIALRVDFCSSSILFTGDAEHDEEALLDPRGPVTLLQVAHHGSDTSTTPAFLARTRPRYAVVSAGRRDEGLNRAFCHPRAIVVRRLARWLGGSPSAPIEAFDGERCDRAVAADWIEVPGSDRLWATERDGDVVLTTTGDGVFRRIAP